MFIRLSRLNTIVNTDLITYIEYDEEEYAQGKAYTHSIHFASTADNLEIETPPGSEARKDIEWLISCLSPIYENPEDAVDGPENVEKSE